MTTLSEAIAECATVLMGQGDGRFTVDDVVECARRDHPQVWIEHSETGVWRDARDMTKKLMRRLSADDGVGPQQMSFPGLHLPTAIAVRSEEGIYYVATPKAVWRELLCGEAERSDNISAAIAKHRDFVAALDVLRPAMETMEDVTVEEALELLAGEAVG